MIAPKKNSIFVTGALLVINILYIIKSLGCAYKNLMCDKLWQGYGIQCLLMKLSSDHISGSTFPSGLLTVRIVYFVAVLGLAKKKVTWQKPY